MDLLLKMAKRKSGVNDIIYELDNSDIEVISDDEGKEAKIGRFVSEGSTKTVKNKTKDNKVFNHDIRKEITETVPQTQNGGKTMSDTTLATTKNAVEKEQSNNVENPNNNIEVSERRNSQCSNTILFDEVIDIGSPTANSDFGVVGCQNKIPLVTVRFKDIKLAKIYKKQVKEFLVNLLKSKDAINLSDADTDVEIDIWPEDLVGDHYNDEEIASEDDNLFFIDTDPCGNPESEVPAYSKVSHIISNISEKEESSPSSIRRKISCFNCDGEHSLRDCLLPRDNNKIAENRKQIVKVGRYHVEDEQKYGHLLPGRISASLRSALGLGRYELPFHIYKMRLLGYPPGWLQDARISHSGIRLFDASGSAILEPDEEDGELNEPGSKDKYDIKKILDFPGFNVPASSRYVEEGHLFGFPPMSDIDSKMLMLQSLAPNAMKAYKRKKLKLFPANSGTTDGQMEMELDSGDEIPEFPSKPPLPDEAPPPPPPPPPPLPEEKHTNTSTPKKTKVNKSPKKKIKNKNYNANDANSKDNESNDTENNAESTKENKYNNSENNDKANENNVSDKKDDLVVLEVMQVPDIPVPGDDFIVIDEEYSVDNISAASPTLADLEEEKRQLLSALKDGGDSQLSIINISDTFETNDDDVTTDIEEIEALLDDATRDQNEKNKINENDDPVLEEQNDTNNENIDNFKKEDTNVNEVEKDILIKTDIIDDISVKQDHNESKTEETLTPNQKTGKVKTTLYGTPVINTASPFLKLPGEDKFSKDICDVINFENLPNSTGKYKEISKLLKKVKSEVDRIQDS